MATHVASPIRPPQPVQHHHGHEPTEVLRDKRAGERRGDKVPHGLLLAPIEHIRPEAIVRESFHRIDQCFLGPPQEHEVGFRTPIQTHLIRVMLSREPAKPRLDRPFIGKGRHSQRLVVVSSQLDLVEGLVERVEEVAGDHEDKDAAAMTLKARGLGHGTSFPGANGHAIVDALEERRCILAELVSCVHISALGTPRTLGRTAHPMNGRTDAMADEMRSPFNSPSSLLRNETSVHLKILAAPKCARRFTPSPLGPTAFYSRPKMKKKKRSSKSST